ncbi:phosphoethanolamine--lipid A transferase EptA [Candidatus Deianiraea vastatrix]|uniref:EptA-like lipid A phosphoethanolamine transferase n=1 Tax=Candidatus Deianiraea vastatrix TaxID=2163644 RepID=A0A5B8XID4_9RICK|nr:phosphoethanolamine--lipid A transferase EptA [Candidatus Deianiraea vastatrix]QED23754.1 Putative EptA-like lipid A phosphoethanolamine transferase [Candidatus Deianiraea vastatrix]
MLKNFRFNITKPFLYSLLTLCTSYPLFTFACKNIAVFSLSGVIILFECLFIQIIIVYIFGIILSVNQIIFKIFTTTTLLINSICFYFCTQYTVIIDKTMISNVFNTNHDEAVGLFNIKIIFYVIIFGILPSIILICYKECKISFKKCITRILVSIFGIVILLFVNSKSWLWIDKNAKHLGGLIMPFSYIGNTSRYILEKHFKNQKIELISNGYFDKKFNNVVILVIGESARRNNFSLYGYDKKTNPYLEKDGVFAMPNTQSCTTYTTGSIECMLSHLGSSKKSAKYENLPSYIYRHGIDVILRSNNWGMPKMNISKIENTSQIQCNEKKTGKTYDDIMLCNLKNEMQNGKNQLIILHQSGSHGPLYHEKYPQQFEHFTPVCKTTDLQKCTQEELINAYDNTILYTDYFLHKTIEFLKQNAKSSALIYISDHGESLGEYNIYLHGTPYSIAPKFQKEIPFLVWMSEDFKKQHNINAKKFAQNKDYSQDYIFHSVMGAFGMKSEFYRQELDIFSNHD